MPQRLRPLLIFAAAFQIFIGGIHVSQPNHASSCIAHAFVGSLTTSHSQGVALFADRSYSSDLDTAHEWLAKDRVLNEPDRHEEIRWLDPTTNRGNGAQTDDVKVMRMPLYPLGAVHIPHSGENHTIINIESKNVNMAMDLVNGKWESSLFCASLRARDTNRVASVGTIMQLLDMEDRSISGARTWPGNVLPTLNRVVANCMAVGVADIILIEETCDYENHDYLVAHVKIRSIPQHSTGDDAHTTRTKSDNIGNDECAAKQVIDDYQKVRSIYINSQSLASNELPKFARNAVQTLPTFGIEDVRDEAKFWKLVETWQMLCNTIRQSKQTQLQSMVNELSVGAAMQAKGPLELPVKRRKLPLDIQMQLEGIEQSASRDFMELGMDPVLDFQEILSMGDHWDRVGKFAWMVKRERSRLEAKESLIRTFLGEEFAEEVLTIDLDDDQKIFN